MTRAAASTEQIKAMERMLLALLRKPRTRPGLIAAASSKSSPGARPLSRNFVYGWVTERTRDGTITATKSAGQVWYQVTSYTVERAPDSNSVYPNWLDPRGLPEIKSRLVMTDGMVVRIDATQITKKKRV